MDAGIRRRDFLKAVPAAAAMLASAQTSSPIRLEPFDYEGVRLLDSPWLRQVQSARQFYLALPDDDILHGFRAAAGLPAPGEPLGGWARTTSGGIFGQWLSGMARLYRATDDTVWRDKAANLLTGFAKTVKQNGDCGMRHYPWDKLVCGLVDLHLYAGLSEAIPVLEKTTAWAMANLDRTNTPASKARFSGSPGEWYTLSENLYRAYQVTGDSKFKSFAEVWLYHPFWDKFQKTAAPASAHGVHAYSHVNTFSGAAAAYAVTGDPTYLQHHPQFLRLHAEHAVLRHRRVRAQRTLYDAR